MKIPTWRSVLNKAIILFLLISGFSILHKTNAAPSQTLELDVLDSTVNFYPDITPQTSSSTYMQSDTNKEEDEKVKLLLHEIARVQNYEDLPRMIKLWQDTGKIPKNCVLKRSCYPIEIDYNNLTFKLSKIPGLRKDDLLSLSRSRLNSIFDNSSYIKKLAYSFFLRPNTPLHVSTFDMWQVHVKSKYTLEDFIKRDYNIDEIKKITLDLIRIVVFLYKQNINPVPFITLENIVLDSMDNFIGNANQVLQAVDLRYTVRRAYGKELEMLTKNAMQEIGRILEILTFKKDDEIGYRDAVFMCDKIQRPAKESSLLRDAALSDLISLLKYPNSFWIPPEKFLTHYLFKCVPLDHAYGKILIPKDDSFGERNTCKLVWTH